MKKLLPVFLLLTAVYSCRSNRIPNEEKDLLSLINRLNKKGSDDKLMADIQNVYNSGYIKAKQRLDNYQYDPVPAKWDRLIAELEGIQRMYDIVNRNAYAIKIVKPVNAYPRLMATKDSAANDFYFYGSDKMLLNTRAGNREAYYAFDKAQQYVPNYRDASTRMKEAFDKSIVQVLVNNFEYDVMGLGSFGWNSLNGRDRQHHSNMIRDLGGQGSNSFPAKFYDQYEMRRSSRNPDYVVDLIWRNVRFDQNPDRNKTYNRSKQIETGKDTANKPIYATVVATVYVTERELNATGDLNLIITHTDTREQVLWDRIPSNYRYTYEFARYTGDQRALESSDLTLINRSNNQPLPSRDEAMGEMIRRIYDQTLNRIRNTVSW
ncbi:hypothetical protein ESA94_09630 [Lacibacter luteus]|uniref:Lipoprotein n=1 Tax=Lacibacter luteus TaxID=2508719 RepID=A0A4Q1CJG5_9BACT|nr:hypothetical protein [Lacibacter luteus]RXK60713.1 hypothetical protein ESA94_09630 [Lacibacter luteus]